MRRLKTYKAFESTYEHNDEILKDIQDIIIELNDSGRISAKVFTSQKFGTYVGFFVKDTHDMEGFYFDEIEDYVFRIKDYLGTRYRECSALFQDQYDNMDHSIDRELLDLDNPKTLDSIRKREIKNLIIQIEMDKTRDRQILPRLALESSNYVDNIISDLEDICLELDDMGVRTVCKHNVPNTKYAPLPGQREHISVGLEEEYSDDYKEELTFGKVEDIIFRILNYMKSCGWKPSYVIFDGEAYHIEHRESAIEYFINNFKSNYVLSGLQIDFIREEK